MKTVLLALILFATYRSNCQNLVMTDETTDITFATKNFFGKFNGSFKGVKGTAYLDSANVTGSFIKIAFDPATGALHDNVIVPDLIKAECFNTAQFPAIELASTAIEKLAGPNEYQFHGTLKVKDISKSISFPFKAIPNVGGYDFHFAFPLYKRDYNLNCAVSRKFNIKVFAYGKRIVSVL